MARSISDEDIEKWRLWRQQRFGNWVGALKSGIGLPPPVDFNGYEDILAQCRAGRTIGPWEADMPPANSGDSYNRFIYRNTLALLSYAELDRRLKGGFIGSRQAAKDQEIWEAEQRARQQAKEAEAQRQWDIEDIRRATERRHQAETEALRMAHLRTTAKNRRAA